MSSTDYSSDDSSDRSYHNPAHDQFCGFQTGRFHGHECSRYFDCPGHTIERAASDRSASEDEDDEDEDEDGDVDVDAREEIDNFDQEEEDNDEGADHEQFDGSPGISEAPLMEAREPVAEQRDEEIHEHDEEGEALGSGSERHDIVDLKTPSPPRQSQIAAGIGESSTAFGQEFAQGASRSQHGDVIDLTEDSPEPSSSSIPRPGPENQNIERALPTIPRSFNDSSSSLARSGSISPSAQRRPITPPEPPPPIRRRTSTNNFGTAPRPSMMQPPRPSVSRRPSEVILPRWQPDAEVTFCPICRTQFSVFIRKHHCRKCGRVVCARCSPHRITIPYQYIVQPPGTPRPGVQRYPSSLISGEGGHADFSSLGGGEKVRLCNPCVPDPNTNPPESQGSPTSIRGHGRSQSTAGTGGAFGTNTAGPSQQGSYFDAYVRNRSATMLPSGSRQTSGGRFYQPTSSRILSGTPPSNYHHAHAGSPFGSYRTPRHRSNYDMGQSSSSSMAHRRPLPPDPPQLAEEDECPICHRELPPQSLANFEELREAHISTCITSHSTYGGTPTGEGSSSRPRRTGMFPYVATEKDCVDSAECTICLEEFEVGVPMARLECLCRFHRDCISRWFAKNPGRCPVHSHDGHGF